MAVYTKPVQVNVSDEMFKELDEARAKDFNRNRHAAVRAGIQLYINMVKER